MSAAYAGRSPWNEYQAVAGNLGDKRSFTHGDMQWSLSSGWHFKRNRGQKSSFKMGNILGYDGEKHKVRIYDDYIGFHANENHDSADYQRRIMYAQNGFSDPDNIRSAEIGEGHISKVEYAIKQQVLRVTFSNNGSICLFFRVPAAVAATLINFAKSGATIYKNGVLRHKLGVSFWDYIRIRGCSHGAKYPWEYEKHVDGTFVKSGQRHNISITYKDAVKMFGENSSIVKRIEASGKPTDAEADVKVSVVLNDEEYEKLGEFTGAELKREEDRNFEKKFFKKLNQDKSLYDLDYYLSNDSFENDLVDRIAYEQDLAAGRVQPKPQPMGEGKAPSEDIADAYMAFVEKAYNVVSNKLENERIKTMKERADVLRGMAADIHNAKERAGYKRINEEADDEQAFYDLYKKLGPQTMAKLLRIRGKGHLIAHITNNDDPATIRSIIREAFGKGAYDTWLKKNLPAKYATRYLGRLWSPQDLMDFANPTVPNGISLSDSIPYKRFIAAKDWTAALNFLKSHSGDVNYVDSSGVKHMLTRQRYASQWDQLAEED